jgi:hypothetical protein
VLGGGEDKPTFILLIFTLSNVNRPTGIDRYRECTFVYITGIGFYNNSPLKRSIGKNPRGYRNLLVTAGAENNQK